MTEKTMTLYFADDGTPFKENKDACECVRVDGGDHGHCQLAGLSADPGGTGITGCFPHPTG